LLFYSLLIKIIKAHLKISIITVVFDAKAFLKDAIDAVLSQTYPNIEYIIIDGGSTDGSMDIIQSYEGKITKIISEPDKGIYDAMNKGISIATGDVIGFLNSDDFYTDTHVLSKIAATFDQDTDAVYADLDYVSNQNKNKIIRAWRSGEYHTNKFYMGWMPPHPTFFARKEVYEKFGGYNTSIISSADYELMLRVILKYQINLKYIPEVFVKMRVGGQSNRSFTNRIKANLEDRKAWNVNNLKPKIYTFWLKPLQKIIQYRFW
jgi:glycosyltransferase involved in cell wall biosynthesis